MDNVIIKNLSILKKESILQKSIVLWGLNKNIIEISEWLQKEYGNHKVIAIVDNFKGTFRKELNGIPVKNPFELTKISKDSFVVLFATVHYLAIFRQLSAYEISEAYNLLDLEYCYKMSNCDVPYHFIKRSKDKSALCYILAGYERDLWDNVLNRISAFQSEEFDYCIVSSGKYDKELDEIAEQNQWSYLYTERNQVCHIQNLVVDLHPFANYIIKMDEDIFVGKSFFDKMLAEYKKIEKYGEYRIGFAVPIIPLNCAGYVSYLKLIGKKEEFEKRFGRAYRSRFSAVFDVVETANFLWDTMESFDSMCERFFNNNGYNILDCYFNIGCIMFTRERWLMMGKWPENPSGSGMGEDERFICIDNAEKDMAIYEIQSVLAGHLAFGHQKKSMMNYYDQFREKFEMKVNEHGNFA